ncbi:Hypothetical predicted protein [Olea europaea subsp. europaea]|uniref:Uncharacterized protein n=2 Tax=Olea europaea subsp. europaea TaxID=158383 RepID=A0A8S0S0P5_OLEEU|nr:Hypothetical predicted protein [Olea europaea subsp. europaea]
MGQGLSRGQFQENDLFVAVQIGELETVEAKANENPNLLRVKTIHRKLSALYFVVRQIEVICVLLDWCSNPNIFNRRK